MALKAYKPTSPGIRGTVLTSREDLWTGKPEKTLVEGIHKSGGRNHHGHITSRFRGGGAKRLYRIIDFRRNKLDMEATVVRIEYDPNRTARIALIEYTDGEKAYILAPKNLKAGDVVISAEKADAKPGNAMQLRNMPVGTIVHNVELKPAKGGQIEFRVEKVGIIHAGLGKLSFGEEKLRQNFDAFVDAPQRRAGRQAHQFHATGIVGQELDGQGPLAFAFRNPVRQARTLQRLGHDHVGKGVVRCRHRCHVGAPG